MRYTTTDNCKYYTKHQKLAQATHSPLRPKAGQEAVRAGSRLKTP